MFLPHCLKGGGAVKEAYQLIHDDQRLCRGVLEDLRGLQELVHEGGRLLEKVVLRTCSRRVTHRNGRLVRYTTLEHRASHDLEGGCLLEKVVIRTHPREDGVQRGQRRRLGRDVAKAVHQTDSGAALSLAL